MAYTNDRKVLTGEGLMELADLISRQEYNWGIVRSRQIMEEMVRGYVNEDNVQYTNLADTIESLYRSGRISRDTRDAFHNIRVLGNKAVREGDNDPQDAKDAYFLIKQEMQTFAARNEQPAERTPVRVEPKKDISAPTLTAPGSDLTDSNDGVPDVPYIRARQTGDNAGAGRSSQRNGSGKNGRKGNASNGRKGGKKPQKKGSGFSLPGNLRDFDGYDILKIVIPVVLVILLIILIRSLMPAKNTTPKTTAQEITTEAVQTETEAPTEAPTEPPTTAAVEHTYRVKADGVRFRFADDQNRIYDIVSKGTKIGKVQEIEGSDFVKFTMDGKELLVSKNYIEIDE